MPMGDVERLEALLHSNFPILVVETDEEQRAQKLLERAARVSGFGVQTWSICQGFKRLGKATFSTSAPSRLSLVGESGGKPIDPRDPEQALGWVVDGIQHSVILLMDFHPYLTDPKVVRQLKETAQSCEQHGNRMVLISHALDVPPELRKLTHAFTFTMPSTEQLAELVDKEASVFVKKGKAQEVQIDPKARELLIGNLMGLNHSDAERLIRNAIHTDNAITLSDIPEVTRAKYALIDNNGALSFEYDTADFNQIGGFSNLKQWVDKRGPAILGQGAVADRPKGLMLLGVQGCGKSLAARAIAGQLGVPLIRLDMGAIYNKYIGESERNVRELLRSADVMAPCVLWIDEIEKGISGGGDEASGAPRRVLGTLLTWMQEAKSGVFTVATANDIEALPPELMRKGRLDEVFFVDLPGVNSRRAIVEAVLRKREMPVAQFDLDKIAEASDGFSGAEIEQAVISSLYSSGASGGLSTHDVVHEMALTQPLSVVRRESIEYLRNWARDRTVSVDS